MNSKTMAGLIDSGFQVAVVSSAIPGMAEQFTATFVRQDRFKAYTKDGGCFERRFLTLVCGCGDSACESCNPQNAKMTIVEYPDVNFKVKISLNDADASVTLQTYEFNSPSCKYHAASLSHVGIIGFVKACGEWIGEPELLLAGLNRLIPVFQDVVASVNLERSENETLLLVDGMNMAGYSVGFTPPGSSARQEFQGPLVPGPWAYASPHASVMDCRGGTGRIIDEAAAAGKVVRVKIGDNIRINGQYTAKILRTKNPADRDNIRLVPIS